MEGKPASSVRIALPPARGEGSAGLEECLARRRSVREFGGQELTAQDIAQLLWAAQGVTAPREGLRTAPSAGALYPLTVYVVRREGLGRYLPAAHALETLAATDLREHLARAAGDQQWVAGAAAVIVIVADCDILRGEYGERAERYALLEAGHVAQNIHLQAVALGLASAPVGAFDDDGVSALLGLDGRQRPVYLVPVGRPAAGD